MKRTKRQGGAFNDELINVAQVQLHSGLDMLYTVQEAMAERPDEQTNYAEALYGVYDYLKMVEGQISMLIEAYRFENR